VAIKFREPKINLIIEIGPAVAILSATLFISIFIAEFTFTSGVRAIGLILFRFFRLSLVLALPLLLLPAVCALMQNFFNRGNRNLVQVEKERDPTFHPMKSWILRPIQGIGLAMMVATKLMDLLQIYTGSTLSMETIFPPREFNPWNFITATAVGVVISLLLSFLWSLDDLGIRFYNKKTRELKMIGRYLGLFLPIFAGFYGIVSHFENYTHLVAAKYLGQMVIILYPPFVLFSVLHSRYLIKREVVLLARLRTAPAKVLLDR
jgi:hypothetical protein